jgi:hypothetical protein
LYLGLTVKGIVFALLTVGLIDVVDRGADAFGLLIPIFWLFVMLDAHRSAQAINRGAAVDDMLTGTSPKWWGGSLIVLGALFLLYNFDLFDFDWVWRFWPLALIVLGVKLLRPAPVAPPAPTPPDPPSTPLDEEPHRVKDEMVPPDTGSEPTDEGKAEATLDEGEAHERSEDG